MCGRFARFATGKQLEERYQVREALREALQPRYNIAPTQPVVAVRFTDEGRSLTLFVWGLIPSPDYPLLLIAASTMPPMREGETASCSLSRSISWAKSSVQAPIGCPSIRT
jgi:putative SOS response-associated peptidase YedK